MPTNCIRQSSLRSINQQRNDSSAADAEGSQLTETIFGPFLFVEVLQPKPQLATLIHLPEVLQSEVEQS